MSAHAADHLIDGPCSACLLRDCRRTLDVRGALDVHGTGALNRALTVVLDGIEATLDAHRSQRPTPRPAYYDSCAHCSAGRVRERGWPCPDHRRASASLAAIAEALGVQEEGP